MGGLSDERLTGNVKLVLVPEPRIDWKVVPGSSLAYANKAEAVLHLESSNGLIPLSAWIRNPEGGWSNGATIGGAATYAHRLIAHWFNLPNWHCPIILTTRGTDGSQSWWNGRSLFKVQGWVITIDRRQDHRAIWTGLDESDVYVMTHVMEIARIDGSVFLVEDAQLVVEALHVAVSFAMARWTAPMLPVAMNDAGRAVWQDWRPLKCDPARRSGHGWWYESDYESLASFIAAAVPAFLDADRYRQIRMQMLYAIAAAGERALVEQRIMTAAAGLEHVSWERLVLGNAMTASGYRSHSAAQRLRKILHAARIPTSVPSELLPAAAEFIASEEVRRNCRIDGPDLVTQVRNRLVHPKGSQDDIFERDGLLVDVWLLVRYYLEYLILHSVGFDGLARDTRIIQGWAGNLQRVPWSSTTDATEGNIESS
jgi:hypothetical protein